jgi:uncharacterized protein with NRDE domain
MCLILFAHDIDSRYRLLLAANRDEFYERPTLPLAAWDDHPDIFAGRDLKGGGTWLGITRSGRMAAVTNYRDPRTVRLEAPSRGFLVRDFLTGSDPPGRYLARIGSEANRYNGFNLIVGDPSGLWYFSNHRTEVCRLEPGIYGLSNRLLDTGWPKVKKGKAALQQLIEDGNAARIESTLALLADRTPAPDDALPDTGVGLPWERILSPIFISSQSYGTRSSSVIQVSRGGEVTFVERSFLCQAGEICSSEDRRFDFSVSTSAGEDRRG